MMPSSLCSCRIVTHAKTSAVFATLVLLLTVLLMPAPGRAQIVVDDFSTNQASLSLTYPPAGTSASSSASGAGILGGERDMQVNLTAGVIAGNTMSAVVSSGFFSYSQDATISGNGVLQWDGADSSPTLNPTGLGGIDLTAGGTQDAFDLSLFFDDLPVNMTFTVFTDAGNASTFTLAAPGLVFSATRFVIPFASFTTSLGTGANFANVGAVTLSLGSAVSAPDVVIDFLRTTATIQATKTVAILVDGNGDGQANPGETLRYTVVITNPDDAQNVAATGVSYANAAPADTTLVVGSVTSSQGPVTTGNGGGDQSVAVDVGTIADGASVTITFDVLIDNPLPANVTQILCQGTISSSTLGSGLTDDPTPGGTADPTIIPVSGTPVISATKADLLFVDANGNGQLDPGETVRYTVVITDTGNVDVSGVVFSSGIDPNTQLVVGSVTTSQGTVTTGNSGGDTSVSVNVGTVSGGGGSVTIQFDVTVNNPFPPGVTQIACQGTVTGSNISPTPTDDPDTGTPNDPTVTPVVTAVVTEIPTLDQWGLLALIAALFVVGASRLRNRRRGLATP